MLRYVFDYTIILALCILSVTATLVAADGFRFASYYGDHMVLQKDPEQSVVWGYGANGAKVTVTLSGPQGSSAHTVNVTDGIWKVTLDPVQAGGPYNMTAIQHGSSSAKLSLTDVLFGDIWLCGGQSNMAFVLSQVFNASAELALASKFPHVRIFQAALGQSNSELIDLPGVEVPWSVPTAELLGGKPFTHFSAVCWIFGRDLYKTLKYPIGLVESCWGGTPVEAWSAPRVLHGCGLPSSMDNNIMQFHPHWNIMGPMESSVLWNAMIHPLLTMTIKGAIWYQGEFNCNYNRDKYACMFPSMIDDWRMAFHTGSGGQTALDFPFGFVQLCTYRRNSNDGFPEVRWHQTADYGFAPNDRMKRTFMAVAMDLPDEKSPYSSIHPRDKQDVAYRLVLGARAVAYGEKGISFQGPFPSKVLINETYMNIIYNQNVSVTLSDGVFEICCSVVRMPCGPRSMWIPAAMKPLGPDSVLVSTSKCPVDFVAALRYAWRDWPCNFKACPIYSADGVLPAPSFVLNRWP